MRTILILLSLICTVQAQTVYLLGKKTISGAGICRQDSSLIFEDTKGAIWSIPSSKITDSNFKLEEFKNIPSPGYAIRKGSGTIIGGILVSALTTTAGSLVMATTKSTGGIVAGGAIAGIGATIGFCCTLSGWSKIRKAGYIMDAQPYP
jgi:hypothetical protein